MEEGKKEHSIDISKKIEESVPKVDAVTPSIAREEEEIAKEVEKIPFAKDELAERKEKFIKFLREKRDLIYYIFLSIIVFLGVYIRTRNIPGLKDITTGTWTLGPDLDPFLFLRWAKYIVENGKLFTIDTMRYIPLADFCTGTQCNPVSTTFEMRLLSYMIAWFHNFLSLFSENISVTFSAIIFPVVMFALTTIAFFLFARKIFYKQDKKTRNIIALVSTAFFVLVPSLISRTIAGIPEKESAAFFFMFISLYFFLEAFTAKELKYGIIFGALAGILTACMGLTWGGAGYVYITVSIAVIFSFLLGKIDTQKFIIFGIWVGSFVLTIVPFSSRYSFLRLASSTSTGLMFLAFFIILVDFLLFKKRIIKIPKEIQKKIPERIISILIAGIILILLATIFFGISFIPGEISDFISQTVHPLDTSRFSATVAENKQPYFLNDWKNEFGPIQWGIPLYFWLFFIGSVFLFNYMIRFLSKKEKRILTFSYILFLLGLIFSKYSSGGILNGDNAISLIVYFGGMLLFLFSFGLTYFRRHKEENLSIFKEIDFSLILYFMIFIMAVIGARGAIRLIMVLGSVSPIVVGFLIVMCVKKFPKKGTDDMKRFFGGIAIILILVTAAFTFWAYYNQDKSIATNYTPSAYQWQWQKTMEWIRENTPVTAVFAHWWDYGYWIQSIGERATVLDGGNGVAYWNYFMGRHVLTGTEENSALEFLYAHNATHLLIDSTDINKYTAFSSIGSDEDYDRFSWISTFLMDTGQTQETNGEIIYFYTGGSYVDADIIIESGDKEILLPKKQAVVGAIVVRLSGDQILQPEVIFVYNGKQYLQPLRYAYVEESLYDFGTGLEAGIFVFPSLSSASGEALGINKLGALLYLSERTINSHLTRLYLFGEESNYFNVAHIESSIFIQDLRDQGLDLGEFVYYNGLNGPIKIWDINYPSNIELNTDYLDTNYPKELQIADPNEY